MTANLAESAPAPADGTDSMWRSRRRVVLGVALAAGLVFAGYLGGLRSPWSAHQPTVVTVSVERVRMDVPYGGFTLDGDQVGFRLDDIVWRSDSRSDDGGTIPSCLRQEGTSVEVEVGMIEVNRPFGSGSYWEVLSLTCPPGT